MPSGAVGVTPAICLAAADPSLWMGVRQPDTQGYGRVEN
jgi:hypothetical protein